MYIVETSETESPDGKERFTEERQTGKIKSRVIESDCHELDRKSVSDVSKIRYISLSNWYM
jgi:hypothetical protein